MRIEPEISGVSIVLLGDFNPAIFTPAWFALHGLLTEQAANSANLQIAHPDLTIFSTEWVELSIQRNHFQASTQREPYIRVCDLLVRVFKEHLYHTPIKAFGINREVHFRVKNQVERDNIGKLLAPIEPWGPWKDELKFDDVYGGMTSLTMSQNRLPDRPQGSINITVEPSLRIADMQSGIYVRINDHYAIESTDTEGQVKSIKFLEDRFEESIKRSDGIVDHVMSLSQKKGEVNESI